MFDKDPAKLIKQKERQMEGSVKILDFETAAILRDEILELQKILETKRIKKEKEAKVKNPRNKDMLM
jgi:excinuclease UvrABC nuclease subunit